MTLSPEISAVRPPAPVERNLAISRNLRPKHRLKARHTVDVSKSIATTLINQLTAFRFPVKRIDQFSHYGLRRTSRHYHRQAKLVLAETSAQALCRYVEEVYVFAFGLASYASEKTEDDRLDHLET